MFDIAIAVMLDILFGEPPEIIHPTVWFGRIIGTIDKVYVRKSPIIDTIVGAVSTLIVVIFALALAEIFHIFRLDFLLLFAVISIRSMIEHARNTLKESNILKDKVKLIVSRNVESLGRKELCSAVIESIAENFVDGVFAPLFYYTIFGVWGAMVYRAVNTCDAMIGYRNGRYEYFGKFAARLDDVLNFVPARLSIIIFAVIRPSSLKTVHRYRGVKLNGGYPMSAMAGVLGVTLVKPGYYEIRAGRLPDVDDVKRAISVFIRASVITAILYTLINLPLASITYLPNFGLISGIVLCSTPMR